MRTFSQRRCLAYALFAAVLAGGWSHSAARAADAPPADLLTLKTQRVVIFKDGFGLMMKDGTATADAQGRVYTTQVPESAVLGTVWAISGTDKILSMTSEWDNNREVRKQVSPCLTVRDLLRANLNRRVTLELDDKRTVTGTAAEILESPDKTDATPFALPGAPVAGFLLETDSPVNPFVSPEGVDTQLPDGARLVREPAPRGGQFVVISNETDRMVLPISKVVSVSGKDLQTTMTREQEVFSRAKRMVFDFGKESAGKQVNLNLFYFTPGVRWIPTYRVTGNLKTSADIALQGEVVNDLEDISGAKVDLVVGVPNFRFKDTVSPLALESVVRRAARGANVSFRNDNQMLNTQVFNGNNSYRAAVDVQPDPGLPAMIAAGSGGEQDLFTYSLDAFSLKKGGRATAALWQSPAPVRNVYTYELKGQRNRSSGGVMYADRAASFSPSRLSVNTIWHQLELTNNSKVPWTTGPAMTMRDSLPLGQDILAYTSIGGKTLLPLTIAVDLRGNSEEEEISRKQNAARFEGYDYALVQKKGTISVTNSRKENSETCVSLAIGGKVESATDGGKVKLNDFRADDWDEAGYMRVNNHSDVTWEFTLKPGETKTISYTVSFYVR